MKLTIGLLFCVFLLTTGCGTITSRLNYDPYEYYPNLGPTVTKKRTSRFYGGFEWHTQSIRNCNGPYKISDECGHSRDFGISIFWWLAVEAFAALDFLTLSLAADTLLLPLTIYETCCTGELSEGAATGNLPSVQRLLKNGTDVNERDTWGHTPLISASWAGHTDIVKILLAHGADVNATTPRGWTALRFAYDQSHNEVADLLKAAGAKG